MPIKPSKELLTYITSTNVRFKFLCIVGELGFVYFYNISSGRLFKIIDLGARIVAAKCEVKSILDIGNLKSYLSILLLGDDKRLVVIELININLEILNANMLFSIVKDSVVGGEVYRELEFRGISYKNKLALVINYTDAAKSNILLTIIGGPTKLFTYDLQARKSFGYSNSLNNSIEFFVIDNKSDLYHLKIYEGELIATKVSNVSKCLDFFVTYSNNYSYWNMYFLFKDGLRLYRYHWHNKTLEFKDYLVRAKLDEASIKESYGKYFLLMNSKKSTYIIRIDIDKAQTFITKKLDSINKITLGKDIDSNLLLCGNELLRHLGCKKIVMKDNLNISAN